mmetsp:Transcript_87089/g.174237  ORF Transcript_87089/g.174237 Transcript_87089/m.174237 type:complete len:214 (+) Transcript_87089:21-662(+)
MPGLGLKGKACLVQAISSPVFVGLAWWIGYSARENPSAEALAAQKMLLFEGIGQVFLAVAAWNDHTRPKSKEFKDDFDGWVKQTSKTVMLPAIIAMGAFFVQVTGARLELASLAFGGVGGNEISIFCTAVALLIFSSVPLKRIPLRPLILGCFLASPMAAGLAQMKTGHTLLAVSQFLYIAVFPLAMARLITRWQGEILNFLGWFTLAYAVVQ